MQTTTTETRACTPDELIYELAKGNEHDLLGRLAGISAQMERHEHDDALFNRLAAAVLGVAFVEGASVGLRPGETREPMEELFRMANGIPSRNSNIVITPQELHERNNRMMLRSFAQHEALLGPLKPALGRAEILLTRILPTVLNGRSNPLDELPKAIGVSFGEARAALLGMYAWTIGRAGEAAPFITEKIFSGTTDPLRTWAVLNAFADTRSALYAKRVADRAYGCPLDADFRYAFSILRDRPLVRLSSGLLIAPVARYLSLAFCDGIYDFLAAHFKAGGSNAKNAFDKIFGDVTEAYVRERFRRELGEGAYIALPELRKHSRRGSQCALSPDGLTGEGDCVLELKGKRLVRGLVTTGNLQGAPGYLGRNGLGHGTAQLLAEIARTRAGDGRGLDRQRLDEVVPCLVTPDGFPGFHLEPVRRWVIKAFGAVVAKEFPEVRSELGALERFEWLSFDDIDRLTRASKLSGCSVGRILRRFRLESPLRPVDARTGSLPPQLRGWLLRRYPEINQDPWLDEAFAQAWEDCTQRMFGASINDAVPSRG